MNICKNRTKIDLPAKYSMYFKEKHAGVFWSIVYIKYYIGNDMDSGHYVCDILDYSTR